MDTTQATQEPTMQDLVKLAKEDPKEFNRQKAEVVKSDSEQIIENMIANGWSGARLATARRLLGL